MSACQNTRRQPGQSARWRPAPIQGKPLSHGAFRPLARKAWPALTCKPHSSFCCRKFYRLPPTTHQQLRGKIKGDFLFPPYSLQQYKSSALFHYKNLEKYVWTRYAEGSVTRELMWAWRTFAATGRPPIGQGGLSTTSDQRRHFFFVASGLLLSLWFPDMLMMMDIPSRRLIDWLRRLGEYEILHFRVVTKNEWAYVKRWKITHRERDGREERFFDLVADLLLICWYA